MQTDSNLNLPQNKPRWEWIISIGLHVLLLIGALFIVPFDRILDRLTNPTPPAIAEDRVQDLAEFIEQTHEETVRIEVERMNDILEQMRDLRDQELDEVRPHEAELIASSSQRALEAQKKALESLDRAADETASIDDRAKAHAEARDAQEEAGKALEASGEAFADASKAQATAAEQSTAASDSTASDRKLRSQIADTTRRIEQLADRAADVSDGAQKRATDAAGIEARATAADESLVRATEKAEAATKALADAGDDKKKQDAARKAAASAAKDLERAKTTATRLRAEADKRRADANKAAATLEEANSRVKAAETELADLKREQQKNESDASPTTIAARESQKRAIEQLERTIAEGARPDTNDVARAEDAPVNVATETLAASVRSAGDLEGSISDAFRRMRAARQAQIRGVTIAEAEDSIQVVKPDRTAIDSNRLNADVRTSEQLEDYKKAVLEAETEVKSMRELAETLLTDAANARAAAGSGAMVSADGSSASGSASGSGSPSASTAAARRNAAMQAAGLEEAGGRAKDLTGIMTGVSNVAQIVAEDQHPTVPEQVFALPIGTRRIGQSGRAAGWVYVDSWYIIGPWDNSGRRNTSTQFPPEQIIDLDGRYPGKGGRTLSWAFHQESAPRLRPPNDEAYGIFYLYTELRFEAPAELWCAVGSDDNSNIWVNGFPVWVHAGPERSWAPAHGYRKVRFNAGVNKILFRLENGHHGSNWSFLIHLPKSVAPPSLPRGE